jgi:hypothetical protein
MTAPSRRRTTRNVDDVTTTSLKRLFIFSLEQDSADDLHHNRL